MDYKTGKHIGKKSLSAEIARGSKLQAPLYAASAEETGMPTAGSYLFLSDDPEVFSVESDDLELQDCFEGAVSEILRALDSGSMPPRMLNKNLGSSGPSCGYCQLKQACSLRDISSQRRLVEDVGQGLLSDAFHRIWHLKETVESLAAQAQEERDISEGAEEEGQDG